MRRSVRPVACLQAAALRPHKNNVHYLFECSTLTDELQTGISRPARNFDFPILQEWLLVKHDDHIGRGEIEHEVSDDEIELAGFVEIGSCH